MASLDIAPRPALPIYRQAKPSELTAGRAVEYKGSWGRGPMRSGKIIGGPFLENEEMVWDVELENGAKHWGYIEQFKIEGDA